MDSIQDMFNKGLAHVESEPLPELRQVKTPNPDLYAPDITDAVVFGDFFDFWLPHIPVCGDLLDQMRN